jgi:hypothetical protein
MDNLLEALYVLLQVCFGCNVIVKRTVYHSLLLLHRLPFFRSASWSTCGDGMFSAEKLTSHNGTLTGGNWGENRLNQIVLPRSRTAETQTAYKWQSHYGIALSAAGFYARNGNGCFVISSHEQLLISLFIMSAIDWPSHKWLRYSRSKEKHWRLRRSPLMREAQMGTT